MLIVTGEYNERHLASTELIDHSNGAQWREVTPLPSPRRGTFFICLHYFQFVKSSGLRGATLSNMFHVTGGSNTSEDFDSILAWDPVSETWTEIGHLKKGRFYHAITTVAIGDVLDLCL